MCHSGATPSDPAQSSPEEIKILKSIKFMKICEFICSGILLLVIFGLLMTIVIIQITSKITTYKEAAGIINTYTSIVLGFIAMTVSLIGVVLSFHNTIQTENSNLSTTKEFTKLSLSIEPWSDLEKDLNINMKSLSEKVQSLEKETAQLEDINKQMTDIQQSLRDISNNIKVKLNQQTGNDTNGSNVVQPEVKSVDDVKTDERNM